MNTLTLLIFAILLIALLEAPLFTVIAGLSAVCLYFADYDWQAFQTIIIEMNRLASMPILTALPLFTFAGCLLTESGAPKRIMNLMQALFGRLPGGIAVAALCSCAFFTALTGASGVTIVALGGVLYPVLRKKKYPEAFSLGLMTTSGSLGLLFPPSLPIILYGVVARVDINTIFKAAAVPGVLLIAVLAVYAVIYSARHRGLRSTARSKRPDSLLSVKRAVTDAMWEWPLILMIILGIYGGLVTIAEVSAVVALYLIVVECLLLKEINVFRQLPGIMIESVKLSGAIIIILGVSLGFTGFLVDEQIPDNILSWLTAVTDNRILFLAGLNVFLLAVGCMMDIFSAIVIIVPIIAPIALTYGVDPIHLCIIFLVNLEIGYATPPVGINLFIASLKFGKPVTALYRASLPYLILLLLALIFITYLPGLSLFLV